LRATEAGAVEVKIPKNRSGTKPSFTLTFDSASGRLTEGVTIAVGLAREQSTIEERIEVLLRHSMVPLSKTFIVTHLGRRAEDVSKALDGLMAARKIFVSSKGYTAKPPEVVPPPGMWHGPRD